MLNRQNKVWLTFLFLALMFAVFGWGLKYKLSLYDPPHSISHSMPAAKLLSNRERDRDVVPAFTNQGASRGTVVPWMVCFLTLSVIILLAPENRSRSGKDFFHLALGTSRRSQEFRVQPLFSRPPPAA